MTASAFRDVARMAARNLARHRTKTIVTVAAVAVSVALYLVMDAWILGMNLDSRRNIVVYEMGAAKLQADAYFEKKDELPMYESFSGWERCAAALEGAGYAAAPRFAFTGTLYSATGAAPLEFAAVDPAREEAVLRYPRYVELGRFPRAGAFELAVGTMAAEKLGVGIPSRLLPEEVEAIAASVAAAVGGTEGAAEADFVRAMWAPAEKAAAAPKAFDIADPALAALDARRLRLRKAGGQDLARLWSLLERAGRMDVRISTTIDIKAATETLRADKFEGELLPSLDGPARARAEAAYEKDEAGAFYVLAASDPAEVDAVLADMVRAGFAGAVRHVNQLVDARVVGIVNSPNPKTNGNIGFLPLDVLQDEAGLMLEGRVTELLIRRKGADDAALPGREESPAAISAALAAGLGGALPAGLSVRGWEDYAGDFIAAAKGDDVSTRVMTALLFLLSLIGIANTMLMAILERTKETGMLRALGMTDGGIVAAYTIEAGLIGLIGSGVGILFGCLGIVPLVEVGVDFSSMSEAMGGDIGYRIASLFRAAWNPPLIAGIGFAATGLSALSALPPTLRALRMPVVDSLRFE